MRNWGINTAAKLKRELRRAEILHDILLGVEHAGFLAQSTEAAFRACRAELRACGCKMTRRNFALILKKWQASPCAESLVRKRRTVPVNPPFGIDDCIPLIRWAFEKKISLAEAVRLSKGAHISRVPSRTTILHLLPWAVAVDAHAASVARIRRGLAAVAPKRGKR